MLELAGLAVYAGDQIAGYALRLLGTIVGLLIGMAVWYIGSGHGTGNPYAIVVATVSLHRTRAQFIVFKFCFFFRRLLLLRSYLGDLLPRRNRRCSGRWQASRLFLASLPASVPAIGP